MRNTRRAATARTARTPAALLSAAVVALGAVAGCGGGPTSREELCDAYREYQKQVSRPHILSNEKVFDSLRELGEAAERYEGDDSVRAAGPALRKMGESDSYRPAEAQMRLRPVRAECRTG
ncbi:hypothetical protein [Actinomadura kijaniata]|uniref:hypothetical protein n=1 Tax=Actinomadura kijaniata TaxID=46161 RepID=UPI0012FC3C82|nr:hypothetical protein [Actinomadura kijaniata]